MYLMRFTLKEQVLAMVWSPKIFIGSFVCRQTEEIYKIYKNSWMLHLQVPWCPWFYANEVKCTYRYISKNRKHGSVEEVWYMYINDIIIKLCIKERKKERLFEYLLITFSVLPFHIFHRLFVVRGSPAEVFPTLFKEWGITKLTFEVDTEPYAGSRDEEIEKIAASNGVEAVKCVSHTLYDVQRWDLIYAKTWVYLITSHRQRLWYCLLNNSKKAISVFLSVIWNLIQT